VFSYWAFSQISKYEWAKLDLKTKGCIYFKLSRWIWLPTLGSSKQKDYRKSICCICWWPSRERSKKENPKHEIIRDSDFGQFPMVRDNVEDKTIKIIVKLSANYSPTSSSNNYREEGQDELIKYNAKSTERDLKKSLIWGDLSKK